MAIAFDASSSGQGTQAGSTVSSTHVCTGPNGVLFAYAFSTLASGSPTATYNGVPMTQSQLINDTGSELQTTEFYLLAPATGSHTLTVTFGSTSGTRCNILIGVSFNGVSQVSTPDGTNQNSSSGAGGQDVSVTTSLANTMLVSGAVTQDQVNAFTVGAGQTSVTQLTQLGVAGNLRAIVSYKQFASPGSNAMTYTWSGSVGTGSAGIGAAAIATVTNSGFLAFM